MFTCCCLFMLCAWNRGRYANWTSLLPSIILSLQNHFRKLKSCCLGRKQFHQNFSTSLTHFNRYTWQQKQSETHKVPCFDMDIAESDDKSHVDWLSALSPVFMSRKQTFRLVSPSRLAVVMWHVPSARSDDKSTRSAGNVSSLATLTISPTYKNTGWTSVWGRSTDMAYNGSTVLINMTASMRCFLNVC